MSEQVTYTLKPIGFLKSCYPDKFGVPRQPGLVKKAYSELKINSEWQPELALQGLDGYSHIWIQFMFHLNVVSRYHAKVHPPRLGGQTIGLFATRTPHRPNPIGLSLVELIKIEKDTLYLAGADLVDGTPVLDIKPYLPNVESIPDAKAGWMGQVSALPIQVHFTEKALELLQSWMQRTQKNELEEVIVETLQLDPRPNVYKGFEQGQSPYRNKHAFRLYDGDVHFEFLTETQAQVFDIRF